MVLQDEQRSQMTPVCTCVCVCVCSGRMFRAFLGKVLRKKSKDLFVLLFFFLDTNQSVIPGWGIESMLYECVKRSLRNPFLVLAVPNVMLCTMPYQSICI